MVGVRHYTDEQIDFICARRYEHPQNIVDACYRQFPRTREFKVSGIRYVMKEYPDRPLNENNANAAPKSSPVAYNPNAHRVNFHSNQFMAQMMQGANINFPQHQQGIDQQPIASERAYNAHMSAPVAPNMQMTTQMLQQYQIQQAQLAHLQAIQFQPTQNHGDYQFQSPTSQSAQFEHFQHQNEVFQSTPFQDVCTQPINSQHPHPHYTQGMMPPANQNRKSSNVSVQSAHSSASLQAVTGNAFANPVDNMMEAPNTGRGYDILNELLATPSGAPRGPPAALPQPPTIARARPRKTLDIVDQSNVQDTNADRSLAGGMPAAPVAPAAPAQGPHYYLRMGQSPHYPDNQLAAINPIDNSPRNEGSSTAAMIAAPESPRQEGNYHPVPKSSPYHPDNQLPSTQYLKPMDEALNKQGNSTVSATATSRIPAQKPSCHSVPHSSPFNSANQVPSTPSVKTANSHLNKVNSAVNDNAQIAALVQPQGSAVVPASSQSPSSINNPPNNPRNTQKKKFVNYAESQDTSSPPFPDLQGMRNKQNKDGPAMITYNLVSPSFQDKFHLPRADSGWTHNMKEEIQRTAFRGTRNCLPSFTITNGVDVIVNLHKPIFVGGFDYEPAPTPEPSPKVQAENDYEPHLLFNGGLANYTMLPQETPKKRAAEDVGEEMERPSKRAKATTPQPSTPKKSSTPASDAGGLLTPPATSSKANATTTPTASDASSPTDATEVYVDGLRLSLEVLPRDMPFNPESDILPSPPQPGITIPRGPDQSIDDFPIFRRTPLETSACEAQPIKPELDNPIPDYNTAPMEANSVAAQQPDQTADREFSALLEQFLADNPPHPVMSGAINESAVAQDQAQFQQISQNNNYPNNQTNTYQNNRMADDHWNSLAANLGTAQDWSADDEFFDRLEENACFNVDDIFGPF